MRVTALSTKKTKAHTVFSADLIFSRPYGGKKDRITFAVQWLSHLFSHPRQTLKFGYTVRKRIWYKVPNKLAALENRDDAFFLLALPMAIATNEDLIFEGSVSQELVQKSTKIQKYYAEIVKRNISIKVQAQTNSQRKNTHMGQFFTLGLDSFYTLCCHSEKNDPTSRLLVYVDGYDIPFYEKKFLNTVHQKIQKVAKKTKNKAVFVETNIRKVSDEILGWGRFHVTGLVAVGTLMGFKKLYISGESFEAADWGLRSGVDTLYSSKNQKVKFVAHGMSREKKIQQLFHSPWSQLFLQNLRVCWENVRLHSLPYNCSNCQKCLKTHLTLQALGVTTAPTFSSVNIQALEKIHLVGHVYEEWQKLYEILKKRKETDPAILVAIEKVLKKPLRT